MVGKYAVIPIELSAVGVRSCNGGGSIVAGGGMLMDRIAEGFRIERPELVRCSRMGRISVGVGWEEGIDSNQGLEAAVMAVRQCECNSVAESEYSLVDGMVDMVGS